MKKSLFSLTVIILSLSALSAQEVVYPSDDMTVNAGSSTMSPASDQLWIANWSAMQNYHQTMFKFDLDEYAGQTVSGAMLKLNQYYHAPDGSPTPCKIYAITETWDESSWSATTNISHGTTEYVSLEFTATTGWYEIDITDLVNDWLDGTFTNNGLILIADSGTKFAQFYSKEATDESNRPRIELNITNSITEIVEDFSFDIYPNPTRDFININLNAKESGKLQIKIVDILGKSVKTLASKDIDAGVYKKRIACNDLGKGIYFIEVQINNQSFNKKLVVK